MTLFDFPSTTMKTTVYPEPPQARQFGLDLIRAIAIAFVLLSHFFKTVDFLGFVGVELFFGLSGYLIGRILWRNFSTSDTWSSEQVINFWARRWWRTLPSYYLFLIISIILTLALSYELVEIDILTKFIWFGQSLAKHHTWFYGVSWSLCVEEFFYFVFPLLLVIVSTLNFNNKITFSISIILIVIFSCVSKFFLYKQGVGADLRLITICRLDAIASGVLVAFIREIYTSFYTSKEFLAALGFVIAALSVLIPISLGMSLDSIEGNPFLLVSVPCAGSLVIPLFGSINISAVNFSISQRIIKNISIWSYSMYLSHMVILTVIYSLEDQIFKDHIRDNIYGNILTKAVGLLFIVTTSAFLYKYVEVPFTNKRPEELNSISTHPVTNQ